MAALNDSLLLARVAGGDDSSFEDLFLRHYDRVYGLLYRLVGERDTAEDLAQEAFIKLHRHAQQRRPGPDENVSAWLYRVAMNLGLNAIRGRRRFWQRNYYLLPDPPVEVEDQFSIREERAAVRAALARLTQRQSMLLLLRQMGFSYAECAAICGVAPGSVGTLLARAAEAFRREYEQATGGENRK